MSLARLRQVRGFTLIEVLVALAIAGIVFVAVGAALKSEIDTQFQLERKAAAAQIAWNLMETYRLDGSPVEPDWVEGHTVMGHWEFRWARRAALVNATQEVEVRIGESDDPVYVSHSSRFTQ